MLGNSMADSRIISRGKNYQTGERSAEGQAKDKPPGIRGGQIRSQNFEQRGGQMNQESMLYRRKVMRNIDNVLEARQNPHENSEDLMPDNEMDYYGGEQY